ncbi:MAG TPA: ATP-binding cassette domain-containing protein, partial [Streptosporangiaceae bacterium]
MTIDNLRSPDLAAPGLAPASRPATAPSPDAPDVLRLDDLHISVHHGSALAVRGISLSIRAGEIVGLVGESGSGKTL